MKHVGMGIAAMADRKRKVHATIPIELMVFVPALLNQTAPQIPAPREHALRRLRLFLVTRLLLIAKASPRPRQLL